VSIFVPRNIPIPSADLLYVLVDFRFYYVFVAAGGVLSPLGGGEVGAGRILRGLQGLPATRLAVLLQVEGGGG
jgi:hypothetical protein